MDSRLDTGSRGKKGKNRAEGSEQGQDDQKRALLATTTDFYVNEDDTILYKGLSADWRKSRGGQESQKPCLTLHQIIEVYLDPMVIFEGDSATGSRNTFDGEGQRESSQASKHGRRRPAKGKKKTTLPRYI